MYLGVQQFVNPSRECDDQTPNNKAMNAKPSKGRLANCCPNSRAGLSLPFAALRCVTMQAEVALSPQYTGALLRGGLVAALLLGLSSLVLDGGLAIQVALMTSLGYLGGVAVIASRRRQAPTATDLWVVRWGFAPLWLAAQVAVPYCWHLMGRL